MNGDQVAANWADLIDGSIDTPIEIDELGFRHSRFAWTSTLDDGTSAPPVLEVRKPDCYGWTTADVPDELAVGILGVVTQSDETWTSSRPPRWADCGSPHLTILFSTMRQRRPTCDLRRIRIKAGGTWVSQPRKGNPQRKRVVLHRQTTNRTNASHTLQAGKEPQGSPGSCSQSRAACSRDYRGDHPKLPLRVNILTSSSP